MPRAGSVVHLPYGAGIKSEDEEPCMTEKNITIYYKPGCSKCRATLGLLQDSGKAFDAVDYYGTPLTVEALRELIVKLGLSVRDILRVDEPLARSLGLDERQPPDDELLRIMVANPDLIQRPIVVRGEEAVLCRPPENVRHLLEK
jgi:arsenate reductase